LAEEEAAAVHLEPTVLVAAGEVLLLLDNQEAQEHLVKAVTLP
jgi:hypothetical protein